MNNSVIQTFLRDPRARVAILVALFVASGVLAYAEGATRIGSLLIALGLLAGGSFVMLVIRPARVPHDAVLRLRLAGTLREDADRSPLRRFVRPGGATLDEIRTALEAARTDARLRAVIVEVASVGAGMATAAELHELLREVHSSGKRVVALLAGDTAGVREYLAASGAGEVVANPDTIFALVGVALRATFVREALKKLGVASQTLQWKEYKGAGEILSRQSMSRPLRESLEAVVADLEDSIARRISTARRLGLERGRELLASGFLSSRRASDLGLIDRLGHIEDLEEEFDPRGKRKPFVGLSRYLRHVASVRGRRGGVPIALVYGAGPVISGDAPGSGEVISGVATAREIEAAARDKRVRAIVFRVNSPGGSAVGSELVWRAVKQARALGKPVVVSMGDVAGSGGYYVAMGADAIVAHPQTVTGSIGVVYAKFDLAQLLSRVGVAFDFAKSADVSDSLSLSRAMSQAELEQMNGVMGELYANFTAKVSQGRGLDPARTEELARGRVWSGKAASSNGLVDELGGLTRAFEIARLRAGIKPDQPHRVVRFPMRRGFFGLKLRLAPVRMGWPEQVAARVAGIPASWVPGVTQILTVGGAMFLCPIIAPQPASRAFLQTPES